MTTPESRTAKSEAELAADLEAELADARGALQDFVATVSHDLRASLRHIISYARLVQEDAGPQLSGEVQGFLATITDSAQHIGQQLDALAALSRVGTQPVVLEPVPLDPLVQQARARVAERYPNRAVQWSVDSVRATVRGDAALVATALEQVLDNALKFTAQLAQAQVKVSAQVDALQGLVHLTIADNGAGFNAALQSKLFQPFVRLHTAKQFPGIGMGLALVRKSMQRMGGTVQAQTLEPQGAAFVLTWNSADP